VVDELNRGGDDPALTPSLVAFLEEWTRRFPRHPRTEETNRERLGRYVLPYLPKGGHEPIGQIRRRALLAVQDQLLRAGLSKTTIDGPSSALSAMFRDAIELEYLEANPAHRLRVRPNDPRLRPRLEPIVRRAVPPEEIHAFMEHVRPGYRAGPQELRGQLYPLRPAPHLLLEATGGRDTAGGGGGLDGPQPARGRRTGRQHHQPRVRARHG
jgi:integrase